MFAHRENKTLKLGNDLPCSGDSVEVVEKNSRHIPKPAIDSGGV